MRLLLGILLLSGCATTMRTVVDTTERDNVVATLFSDGTVRVEVWTPLAIVVRESANLPISFAVDAVEVHCDAVEGKLVLRVGGAPKPPRGPVLVGTRGGSRK